MPVIARRTWLLFLTLYAVFCVSAPLARAADRLPASLENREFWDLIEALSEPNGIFLSENVLSNESGFAFVIPQLKRYAGTNAAYLGVGPEQNFTYIAATRPRMAFIIDIRRENLLEHFLYKALIEMSPDRTDFVFRLFSRTRPDGLSPESTAGELFRAVADAPIDDSAFHANLQEVESLLMEKHKFALSSEDMRTIEHVYTVFRDSGPQLDYNSTGRMPGGRIDAMPTYTDLMTETDSDGRERSYLASNESYEFIRSLENRNLIVPVVGDFGGATAIRAVGKYLKTHRAVVSVFYTSNVEAYLFRSAPAGNPNGGAVNFYNNVRELPLTPSSTFVRSIPLPNARGGPTGWQSLVTASIRQTIEDMDGGRLRIYPDLFVAHVDGVRRGVAPEFKESRGLVPSEVPIRVDNPHEDQGAVSPTAKEPTPGPRPIGFSVFFAAVTAVALVVLAIHRAVTKRRN